MLWWNYSGVSLRGWYHRYHYIDDVILCKSKRPEGSYRRIIIYLGICGEVVRGGGGEIRVTMRAFVYVLLTTARAEIHIDGNLVRRVYRKSGEGNGKKNSVKGISSLAYNSTVVVYCIRTLNTNHRLVFNRIANASNGRVCIRRARVIVDVGVRCYTYVYVCLMYLYCILVSVGFCNLCILLYFSKPHLIGVVHLLSIGFSRAFGMCWYKNDDLGVVIMRFAVRCEWKRLEMCSYVCARCFRILIRVL